MTNDAAPRERNPFLEAVGRITLAGGELDFSLRHLLGAITIEPTLIMYANAANTSQLLEFCRLALTVGHIPSEDIAEIESCLTRADTFRKRRNTIVHALYAPTENGVGIEAMNPIRKNLGYHTSAVSIEEMEALADEVALLQNDMFRAGWNARSAQMPGMQKIPPPAPGQMVNGVLVPE
ncbi:hypothetical protein [Streptomyces hokutonensis]|uniref:hypothetical protein n=1 Tax=Streptomyces hokutonensis TaxID=1306990 RepID=UPI001FE16BAE|nr:hypothetical protein [Streptomyces hokutonensis]